MVLESTIVCVDNSEFMRNGDFIPTRLQAQQDAVSLVCHSKTRSNPENNVGLLTLSNCPEVLATLTSDVGRILSKLHQVQPKGTLNLLTGIRIAHLALKHRQGKNHKMRIIVFVGSPIDSDEKELVKLAKRLKKEKVNVDMVNFGEDVCNNDKLTTFINTINGKDGSGSHLVTVPPGPHLSDALISSPVIQGEDGTGAIGLGGAGFEFGVDPNEDPELALALRVSMEEQRQRQEDEARSVAVQSAAEAQPTKMDEAIDVDGAGNSEEALLEKALALSLETEEAGGSLPGKAASAGALDAEGTAALKAPGSGGAGLALDTSSSSSSATAGSEHRGMPDFASMTEEEQIAYAMHMSLQQAVRSDSAKADDSPVAMETDDTKEEEEDYSDVMNDPEFLQSVLENLPGVDPQSEAVRQVMGLITQPEKKGDKKPEEKK